MPFIMRAGTPPTIVLAGTSFATTAPAATTALSPIVTPESITARAPIQTPFPMRIGLWRKFWRFSGFLLQSVLRPSPLKT